MTITEYIVKKSVYEAEAASAEGRLHCMDSDGSASGYAFSDSTSSDSTSSDYPGAQVSDYRDMKDLLKELKAQGRNLNAISKSAATIALDTRSLSSKRLSETLEGLVSDLRPAIFDAVGSVCERLGAMRPERR